MRLRFAIVLGAFFSGACNVIAGLNGFHAAPSTDDGGVDAATDAPSEDAADTAPDGPCGSICSLPTPVCSHGQCVGVKSLGQGAASSHACVVLDDGHIRCWGANESGELGDGTTNAAATPVEVVSISNATLVATGDSFSCALTSDAHVLCWGVSDHGQLAQSNKAASATPVEVTLPGTPTDLSVGPDAACAVVSGVPYCWGLGFNGEIGCANNASHGTDYPFAVALNPPLPSSWLTGADHTAIGGNMSCFANDAKAALTCIGDNIDGLGDARYIPASDCLTSPTGVQFGSVQNPIPLVATTVELRSSPDVTCLLVTGGRALCWGDNTQGEVLGVIDLQNLLKIVVASDMPIAAKIADYQGTVHISPGTQHVCAVVSQSTPPTLVQCWGAGGSDQLGQGSGPAPELVTGVSDVKDIAAHDDFTCALQNDGQLLCWGLAGAFVNGVQNYYLGSAVTANQGTPIPVAW